MLPRLHSLLAKLKLRRSVHWFEFGLTFLITGAAWMVADWRSF